MRYVFISWMVCLFLAASLFGNEDAPESFLPPHRTVGCTYGPLIATDVEPTNAWISVAWEPKTTLFARRVGGMAPKEYTNLHLSVRLCYVQPMYSADPVDEAAYKLVYAEGLKTLLGKSRTFWFQVANPNYSGFDETGGVIRLDDFGGVTLQEEMIRCGYAITCTRNSWEPLANYDDGYRDKLLRLEGETKAYQVGIWSPSLDFSKLSPEQRMRRWEETAADPKQPIELRRKVIEYLFRDGDNDKYLDLAIQIISSDSDIQRQAHNFGTCTHHCRLNTFSQENRRKYLRYAYELLERIDDGKQGGYFLAMSIGQFLGIQPINNHENPFSPDKNLPQYQGPHGLLVNYFQDTVKNARKWWDENRSRY
jgi:hypothetical protein